jgi:hypothetical protein
MGLQLYGSPSLSRGITSILNVVAFFGLLVYFAAASRDKSIFYWVGVVSAVVSALGGLALFLQLGGRPLGNPNNWAFLPLTGLFGICLGFPFATAGSRGRLTLGVLAVLNLAVLNATWVFLSASRGVLSIAVVCVAYLILSIRGLPRRLAFFTVAGALVFAVTAQSPELQDRVLFRIQKTFDPTVEFTRRTSGRSDLLMGGWHIFKENPFGIGTGGFNIAWASLGDLGGEFTFRRGEEVSPHAGWIKILAENGIMGGLLLAAFVASFAVVGIRKARQSRDLLLLGALVSGVFAVAFFAREFHDKALWFLAAGATTMLHGFDSRMQGRSRAHSGPPNVR